MFYVVEAMVHPDHTVAEVEAALLEEVARLAADGAEPSEIERARNGWEKIVLRAASTASGAGPTCSTPTTTTRATRTSHARRPGALPRRDRRRRQPGPRCTWIVDQHSVTIIIEPEAAPEDTQEETD